ncbi:uncharacterized protein FMAN_15370 [Fusarium mangiferae]|uniref:Uncharacterized protein n=1 Tax=Fusarium mangiferae TaxID=192010 RepID=A0A1L7UDP3_FUSMA|nr:uncharacterized protein FMAN_15370 [Fusarium mangiferae]CVL07282.1 uncharacterized protein FMAN_15370 [Fusarium mangiferae]
MTTKLSYIDHVRKRTQTNPCLKPLVDYLVKEPRFRSRVHILDIHTSPSSVFQAVEIPEEEISRICQHSPLVCTRIVLVENINSRLMSRIGEALDIDPLFFACHVITDFKDIEKAPLPPSLTTLPSIAAKKGYLNIHFQQVLDLGSSATFGNVAYSLKSDSNTPRNVRRLPSLFGRQLGLGRVCCSMLVQRLKSTSICLLLVDIPITRVQAEYQKTFPATRLHGGIEDFEQSASSSALSYQSADKYWNNTSMLSCLFHYFGSNHSMFRDVPVTILGLAYYPVRIILNEWNVYTSLVSRYSKYYEYSISDIAYRLHNDDIIDLQRWRRRSQQSQHKLTALVDFINFHLEEEPKQKRWTLVLQDIRYLQRQIEIYSMSLEQMLAVATSMVQILDSRRSIVEALHIKRLTYVALVFIPLSWVASLFSMGEGFLPGQEFFWIYFCISLPLVVFVLLLSAAPYQKLPKLYKRK